MSIFEKFGLFKNLNSCDSDFFKKVDKNFKTIDSLFWGVAIDIVTTLPSEPEDQDCYILQVGTSYFVCYYDVNKWQKFQVKKGYLFFIESMEWFYYFDGIAFLEVPYDTDGTEPDITDYPEADDIDDPDLFILSKLGVRHRVTAEKVKEYIESTGNVTLDMLANEMKDKLVPVGSVMMSLLLNAPSGYINADGRTIGNTGSGADYSGDQYQALYGHLWAVNNINAGLSTSHPISIATGKGASANDDWAAGKLIRVNLKLNDAFPRFGSSLGLYQGDAMRNITGYFRWLLNYTGGADILTTSGVFSLQKTTVSNSNRSLYSSSFSGAKRQETVLYSPNVPTAPEFRPKAITYNVFLKY